MRDTLPKSHASPTMTRKPRCTWVPREPIEATHDEDARRIEGGESALARREEVPDTAKKDDDADDDQDGGADRGRTQVGNTQRVLRAEDSKGM